MNIMLSLQILFSKLLFQRNTKKLKSAFTRKITVLFPIHIPARLILSIKQTVAKALPVYSIYDTILHFPIHLLALQYNWEESNTNGGDILMYEWDQQALWCQNVQDGGCSIALLPIWTFPMDPAEWTPLLRERKSKMLVTSNFTLSHRVNYINKENCQGK